MLQRSRTHWSAESNALLHKGNFVTCASTEPHSLECGEGEHQIQINVNWGASTEPHSLECGEKSERCLAFLKMKCFNGAALTGVRRDCISTALQFQSWCFNGAALTGVR